MKTRPVEAELFHADGRTDVTKLIVAFRNFANVSKNRNYTFNDILLLTLHIFFFLLPMFNAIYHNSNPQTFKFYSRTVYIHLTQWFGDSIVNNQRFQARISQEHLKIIFLLHRKRSVTVMNIVNYASKKPAICYDNHVKFHEHYVGKSFQC